MARDTWQFAHPTTVQTLKEMYLISLKKKIRYKVKLRAEYKILIYLNKNRVLMKIKSILFFFFSFIQTKRVFLIYKSSQQNI